MKQFISIELIAKIWDAGAESGQAFDDIVLEFVEDLCREYDCIITEE